MNIMATQKFAEHKAEQACWRDLCTKEGAEHLARCIVYYWESRGIKVETQVYQAVGGNDSHFGAVYGVKSIGIPVKGNRHEPGALKGRNWI